VNQIVEWKVNNQIVDLDLTISLSTIKTWEIGVKWPWNGMCNIGLGVLFNGYNFALESSQIEVGMQGLWGHKFIRLIIWQFQ
jgi:hypothetical protein